MSTPQKKRRLGGLFSTKEDDTAPIKKASYAPRPTRPTPPPADSAYGSNSTASSKNEEITPIKNEGQVKGVSSDRHLAVNERTGEVLDDDTGEVVSTVTTTTTTTTTTIKRARSKSPAPGTDAAASETSTTQTTEQQRQQFLTPQSAAQQQTAYRDPSPRPMSELQDTEVGNEPPPPIPPARQHTPNFSSPRPNSRYNTRSSAANTLSQFTNRDQTGQKSTLSSLKDAAVGLHGVGETLRGTLNNSVDSRYPMHRDPSKIEAANQKNQATLGRGHEELGRLQTTRSGNTGGKQWAGATAQQPDEYYSQPWAAPDAPPDPMYHPGSPDHGNMRRKSLSNIPGSFSPESQGQTQEKSGGGLRRFIRGS